MWKTAVIVLITVALLVAISPGGQGDGFYGGPGQCVAAEKRTLEVGLGIRIDANWITLNGSFVLVDRGTGQGDSPKDLGENTREVCIGAVPNAVGWTQKGLVLCRVVRSTAVCVVKCWVRSWTRSNRMEVR